MESKSPMSNLKATCHSCKKQHFAEVWWFRLTPTNRKTLSSLTQNITTKKSYYGDKKIDSTLEEIKLDTGSSVTILNSEKFRNKKNFSINRKLSDFK